MKNEIDDYAACPTCGFKHRRGWAHDCTADAAWLAREKQYIGVALGDSKPIPGTDRHEVDVLFGAPARATLQLSVDWVEFEAIARRYLADVGHRDRAVSIERGEGKAVVRLDCGGMSAPRELLDGMWLHLQRQMPVTIGVIVVDVQADAPAPPLARSDLHPFDVLVHGYPGLPASPKVAIGSVGSVWRRGSKPWLVRELVPELSRASYWYARMQEVGGTQGASMLIDARGRALDSEWTFLAADLAAFEKLRAESGLVACRITHVEGRRVPQQGDTWRCIGPNNPGKYVFLRMVEKNVWETSGPTRNGYTTTLNDGTLSPIWTFVRSAEDAKRTAGRLVLHSCTEAASHLGQDTAIYRLVAERFNGGDERVVVGRGQGDQWRIECSSRTIAAFAPFILPQIDLGQFNEAVDAMVGAGLAVLDRVRAPSDMLVAKAAFAWLGDAVRWSIAGVLGRPTGWDVDRARWLIAGFNREADPKRYRGQEEGERRGVALDHPASPLAKMKVPDGPWKYRHRR